MPLYAALTSRNLPHDKQDEIAGLITDIHHRETGAPHAFIHIVFMNHLPSSDPLVLKIVATVRAGRNDADKNRLDQQLKTSLLNLDGLSDALIEISYREISADWVIEGGAILPHPGHEKEWLEAHWRS